MTDLPDGLRLTGVEPGTDHHAWMHRFLGSFAEAPEDDESFAGMASVTPASIALAIRDDRRIVATSGALKLQLAVTGGALVDIAGVTAVAVAPTYRRRGLLRTMMTRLHDDARERNQPMAALGVSEWPIYGRFGYGVASWGDNLTVDVARTTFRDPVDTSDVREVDLEEAPSAAKAAHDAVLATTPGDTTRPSLFWQRFSKDPASWRDGASDRRAVAIADRAFASYRLKGSWTDEATPDYTLQVTEFLAADPRDARALWQHLCSVDLVTTIKAWRRPLDEGLRWWLVDGRRAASRLMDAMWIRILDVPTALAARSMSADGTVTIAVDDPDGYANGTWRLSADAGHATCEPVSGAAADLTMPIDTLGAVYLGGTSVLALRRAGRLDGDAEAAIRLDGMLSSTRVPWSSWEF